MVNAPGRKLATEELQPSHNGRDSSLALLDSRWLVAVAVLLPTLVAYIGTLGFPFLYDDIAQIVENPSIKSWAQVPGYFSPQIWNQHWPTVGGVASFYRPVFFVWLLLNHTLFGLHPWGWHLALVSAHLGVTFLVYRLTLAVARDKWTALIAGLIFGLHPIHVEGVAWVSGATEPVLALFFIGSFLCLICYRKTSSAWFLVASVALGALALWTKETALVLPAVVIAYEWVFLNKTSGTKWGIWRDAPALARSVLPFVLLTLLYGVARYIVFGGLPAPVSQVSLRTMALTWPAVLSFYIRKLVWPVNLSLFYDMFYVTSASFGQFWLPLLVVAVPLGLVAACARRNRAAWIALLWIMLTILPALNFQAFQWREIAHDRYLYLPSVGFAMLLAIAIRRIPATTRRLLGGPPLQVACGLVLAIGLGGSTVYQSAVWGSPLALYNHAATIAPDNVSAVSNLAAEMRAHGRLDESIELWGRVVRLSPNRGEGWYQLGFTLYRAGRYREAEGGLVRATELASRDPINFYLLGLNRIQMQQPRAAEAALRQAIALQPSGLGFHLALGSVLETLGDQQAALAEFRQELQYHPENQVAQKKLGYSSAPRPVRPQ